MYVNESKWGFRCIWGLLLLGCVCVMGDKWWEHSVHLGGLQSHVWEYTTEPLCHLCMETSARHPQALVWWTLALRGTLSGVWQLGLSVALMVRLRQVTNEKRRQRLLCFQTTGLIEVWAGSRRCSVSHQEKKKKFFFSPKSLQTVFTRHTISLRVKITHFLLVGQEKDRGAV